MALEVHGQPILSQGEFLKLIRGLRPDATGSGVLQAWFAGEVLAPKTVFVALDCEARLLAQDPSAGEIIEVALRRLEEAFPAELEHLTEASE